MKTEIIITDDNPLTDQEIEESAKYVYCSNDEEWIRITNSFIVGAKWARDNIRARQNIKIEEQCNG
jgi:hypothetical protein